MRSPSDGEASTSLPVNMEAPPPRNGDAEDNVVVNVGNWVAFDDEFSDPFDIDSTKKATPESLKRWRQAAFVLNASRRFRYTLDLNKEENKEQRRRMIRAHAQVIRAALLFKLAGQRAIVLGATVAPPTPNGDYPIGPEQLASMVRDQNISALQKKWWRERSIRDAEIKYGYRNFWGRG